MKNKLNTDFEDLILFFSREKISHSKMPIRFIDITAGIFSRLGKLTTEDKYNLGKMRKYSRNEVQEND